MITITVIIRNVFVDACMKDILSELRCWLVGVQRKTDPVIVRVNQWFSFVDVTSSQEPHAQNLNLK
ncbi:hypothetical protein V1478_002909 [Vespula squamosa]|uniref:Uncharacterized protein n=1 Tax=Vespula squamosa TaxID=30214 RepID=A0ABD2BRP3_VESSQ